jgi:hypothetical protein
VVAKTAQEPAVETKAQSEAPPPREEDLPGLDPSVVIRVVNEHENAITGCHVVGYSGKTSSSGSVTLAWSIGPSGVVRDVHIAESSFDDSTFHDCLVSVIAGLEFPEAQGSTEVGGWRFRFRSSRNSGATSSN